MMQKFIAFLKTTFLGGALIVLPATAAQEIAVASAFHLRQSSAAAVA